MNGHFIFLSCLWGAAAAGIAWYCATVGQQITYVTLADGRRQERSLPILFRIFLPLTSNLTPFFRKPGFTAIRRKSTRRLISAGYEGLLSAEELLALRLILPVVLGSIWLIFVKGVIFAHPNQFLQKINSLVYMIVPLWCYAYPGIWLQKVLRTRHRSIQRSLPFVLDLLTLSVEAGMDFMNALQRNIERGKVDPLNEELIRVIREIQLGKTRREALRDMSIRVNLSDLRAVINALVQADELGVSIGSILRIQADQMRQKRFERAETLANQAPVKMLAPLLLFIFPAVFLILLGPVIARLLEQGL
jgi:tight adherence protein C